MASITCRNGETFPKTHTHDSVAAVRQCQGAPSQWKPVDVNKAVQMAEHLSQRPGMTLAKAETELTTFKGRREPMSSRVDPELEAKVPDGRYAITTDDGTARFYRVRKVTSGQWAGRTFVDRQAGDESFPVRFATERAKILTAIAADVKTAAIRYGKELGQCSQCGRTLTNPESIQLGIGPVCLARVS